jgi:hypothetical protein
MYCKPLLVLFATGMVAKLRPLYSASRHCDREKERREIFYIDLGYNGDKGNASNYCDVIETVVETL